MVVTVAFKGGIVYKWCGRRYRVVVTVAFKGETVQNDTDVTERW